MVYTYFRGEKKILNRAFISASNIDSERCILYINKVRKPYKVTEIKFKQCDDGLHCFFLSLLS